MKKEWAPSAWGRKLTRSPDWRLFLEGLKLSLTVDGKTHAVNVDDDGSYRVNPGVFWTDVTLHPGPSRVVKVDGLPNARGIDLTRAAEAALVEKQFREDVAFLRDAHQTVLDWLDHKTEQEQAAAASRRWITHEAQAAMGAVFPPASRDVATRTEVGLGKSVGSANVHMPGCTISAVYVFASNVALTFTQRSSSSAVV